MSITTAIDILMTQPGWGLYFHASTLFTTAPSTVGDPVPFTTFTSLTLPSSPTTNEILGERFLNRLSFTSVGTNANGWNPGGFAAINWHTCWVASLVFANPF